MRIAQPIRVTLCDNALRPPGLLAHLRFGSPHRPESLGQESVGSNRPMPMDPGGRNLVDSVVDYSPRSLGSNQSMFLLTSSYWVGSRESSLRGGKSPTPGITGVSWSPDVTAPSWVV